MPHYSCQYVLPFMGHSFGHSMAISHCRKSGPLYHLPPCPITLASMYCHSWAILLAIQWPFLIAGKVAHFIICHHAPLLLPVCIAIHGPFFWPFNGHFSLPEKWPTLSFATMPHYSCQYVLPFMGHSFGHSMAISH